MTGFTENKLETNVAGVWGGQCECPECALQIFKNIARVAAGSTRELAVPNSDEIAR